MDWNTLAIATIPAIITALISGFSSYILANKNAKVELEKAQSHLEKAKIDQATELEKIKSQQIIAIETIERNAESELKKMKAQTKEQIELYNSRAQTDLKTTEEQMKLDKTGEIFSQIFSPNSEGDFDFDTILGKLSELDKFGNN